MPATLKLTFDGDRGLFDTLQGEGRFVRVPSIFVRLSGCNLRCAWREADGSTTLCDTPYSSFNPENNVRLIDDIVAQVELMAAARRNAGAALPHVVITGGEPFVQKRVTELIAELVDRRYFITVETNATIYHANRAQFVSLSPKLRSSNAGDRAQSSWYDDRAIAAMVANHDYQIKFVVHEEADLEEIFSIEKRCGLRREKIYLMPQGVRPQALQERTLWLGDVCKIWGFNLCPRLHIMLWGNRRGV